MRRLLVFTLLAIVTMPTKGQTIDMITLEHTCSFGLPIDNLYIRLFRFGDKVGMEVRLTPGNGRQKTNNVKVDTVLSLTMDDFARAQELTLNLKTTDLVKSFTGVGADGTSTRLAFGDVENEIAYKIWTLNSRTEERGLLGFREVCKHLTRMAGLEKLRIFD